MTWVNLHTHSPRKSGVYPVRVHPKGTPMVAHWNAKEGFWGTPTSNEDSAVLLKDWPFQWPSGVTGYWKDTMNSAQLSSARSASLSAKSFNAAFGFPAPRGSVFRPVAPPAKSAVNEKPVKAAPARKPKRPVIALSPEFSAGETPPSMNGQYEARLKTQGKKGLSDWTPVRYRNGFWAFLDRTLPRGTSVAVYRGVTAECAAEHRKWEAEKKRK